MRRRPRQPTRDSRRRRRSPTSSPGGPRSRRDQGTRGVGSRGPRTDSGRPRRAGMHRQQPVEGLSAGEREPGAIQILVRREENDVAPTSLPDRVRMGVLLSFHGWRPGPGPAGAPGASGAIVARYFAVSAGMTPSVTGSMTTPRRGDSPRVPARGRRSPRGRLPARARDRAPPGGRSPRPPAARTVTTVSGRDERADLRRQRDARCSLRCGRRRPGRRPGGPAPRGASARRDPRRRRARRSGPRSP